MTKLAQWLGIPRYRADECYMLALRAFSQRKLAAAQAHIDEALELLPGHAEYHAVQGFFAHEDKASERAEACYERAIQLNAYEMLANYGRGRLAYHNRDWAAAAERFVNALAAQPQRPETLYFLAMTQHRLGKNDEAARWMSAAAAGFASSADHRERHCHSWLREFEKLNAVEADIP
ncbi:MAG: tetratricopeptide repeat protein [Chloroflexi bacterium]|nr:tetratricopeptide repeat protein [Chloroflexota bacterium]MCY3583557.1 tetratricopeptide repeat protein [Chloroflexota bacterium]MCY3715799.1 tetratricopeptide repeat protein [Chloroflexota bacterium]MDE2651030.1 tetratricopeptide repeat protein [Chloroflexota bacterium]MXV92453.1 tetratricopeptide repeat protein [Chloroflexota bacterium]